MNQESPQQPWYTSHNIQWAFLQGKYALQDTASGCAEVAGHSWKSRVSGIAKIVADRPQIAEFTPLPIPKYGTKLATLDSFEI